MFLRNEIGDRLVITVDHASLHNTFVTCIFGINDSGLSRISEKTRVGIDRAKKLHLATVAKIENEGTVHYCKCGAIARQYSRIVNDYICADCYALDVEGRV